MRVIVYRNPLEQALWEDPMTTQIIGFMAGIILVIVVGYLVWSLIIQPIILKFRSRSLKKLPRIMLDFLTRIC